MADKLKTDIMHGKVHDYKAWYYKNEQLLRTINTYYPGMDNNMMLRGDYELCLKLVDELDELIGNFLKNFEKNRIKDKEMERKMLFQWMKKNNKKLSGISKYPKRVQKEVILG